MMITEEKTVDILLVEDSAEWDRPVPSTVARRDGVGWRISGTKISVPAAEIADAILTPAAVTDGATLCTVAWKPAEPESPSLSLTLTDTE